MDALARLRAAPEIAVVLGGLAQAMAARARTAAALARDTPGLVLILSGSHPPSAPAPARTEAEVLRDLLRDQGVEDERLLLEDESRDTLGNAVFTAVRYLADIAPRRVLLVTSPYHAARAIRIFRAVLGPRWQVAGMACEPVPGERERVTPEREFEREADTFFAGLRPGDLRAFAARLQERYPYYSTSERLTTWTT